MCDDIHRQVGATAPSPTLLLLPAMGVPPAYYRPLIEQLEGNGYAVIVADFDLQRSSRTSRQSDGYAVLIEERIWGAYRLAEESSPNRPVVLLGHSLGGQLGLVFAGRFAPDAPAILIGCGSAYFRGFAAPRRWVYLLGSQVIAALASVLGFWPGDRLGFGGRQTKRTMLDWARNVRTAQYDSLDASFDYQAALDSFRGPLAVIDLKDDVLASPQATMRLISRTRSTVGPRTTYATARGRRKPGAHFTWARDVPGIVPQIVEWLSEPSFIDRHREEIKESR
ncbi:alpha/beta fold hydrolase [Agromyces atrinae]|uniref:alpha/beta fold hydrolase n=1 Tax=Agromyces atrinae TaxID=592376 RepID=UPI002412F67E|nr:alpha/beta fold hydrolase [Agromyces atrinae]